MRLIERDFELIRLRATMVRGELLNDGPPARRLPAATDAFVVHSSAITFDERF